MTVTLSYEERNHHHRRGPVVIVLAHSGAGLVNTWGFAYVGGVLGVFSAALIFVKGSIPTSRAATHTGESRLARLSRPSRPSRPSRFIIVIGAVSGVSMGLGVGRLLESWLTDTPQVTELVSALCAASTEGPDWAALSARHDDITHVIDDLSLESAAAAHQRLDVAMLQAEEADIELVVDLIDLLAASSATNASPSCPPT